MKNLNYFLTLSPPFTFLFSFRTPIHILQHCYEPQVEELWNRPCSHSWSSECASHGVTSILVHRSFQQMKEKLSALNIEQWNSFVMPHSRLEWGNFETWGRHLPLDCLKHEKIAFGGGLLLQACLPDCAHWKDSLWIFSISGFTLWVVAIDTGSFFSSFSFSMSSLYPLSPFSVFFFLFLSFSTPSSSSFSFSSQSHL